MPVEQIGEPAAAPEGQTDAAQTGAEVAVIAAPEGRPEISQEEEAQDVDYTRPALIPRESESYSGAEVALHAKGP